LDSAVTRLPRELNSGNIADPAYGNCLKTDTRCDLSNKIINSIAPNTFVGYDNLRILYLFDNKITSIENSDFAGLDNLEYLYLSNNDLTKFSVNKDSLPKIDFIDLQ
jgi:Leucine-rich repeat (LRR) protein